MNIETMLDILKEMGFHLIRLKNNIICLTFEEHDILFEWFCSINCINETVIFYPLNKDNTEKIKQNTLGMYYSINSIEEQKFKKILNEQIKLYKELKNWYRINRIKEDFV